MYRTMTVLMAFILVLTVACGGKGQSSKENARFVRVSLILGKVEVKLAGGVFRPARAGMRLGEKDSIRTLGADSSCQLSTPGGSVVRMSGGSLLVMAKLYRDGKLKIEKTGLQLLLGRVIVRAKKLLSNEEFTVRTKGATAGVRGTEFMVSVDNGSNTRVAVKHGSVVVRRVLDIKGKENKEVKKALEKDSTVVLKPAQQVVVKQTDNQQLVTAAETVIKTRKKDDKKKAPDMVAAIRTVVAQKKIVARPAPAVFNVKADPELLREFDRVEKAPTVEKKKTGNPAIAPQSRGNAPRTTIPATVKPRTGKKDTGDESGLSGDDEAALRRKKLLEERRKKMEAARKKALENDETLRRRRTYDDRR